MGYDTQVTTYTVIFLRHHLVWYESVTVLEEHMLPSWGRSTWKGGSHFFLDAAVEVILTFHGTSTLKMEVVCSYKIFVTTYLDACHYINIVQPMHYIHTCLYSSNQCFMHHVSYKELHCLTNAVTHFIAIVRGAILTFKLYNTSHGYKHFPMLDNCL